MIQSYNLFYKHKINLSIYKRKLHHAPSSINYLVVYMYTVFSKPYFSVRLKNMKCENILFIIDYFLGFFSNHPTCHELIFGGRQ